MKNKKKKNKIDLQRRGGGSIKGPGFGVWVRSLNSQRMSPMNVCGFNSECMVVKEFASLWENKKKSKESGWGDAGIQAMAMWQMHKSQKTHRRLAWMGGLD